MSSTSTIIERSHSRADGLVRGAESTLSSAITAARSSLSLPEPNFPDTPDIPDDSLDFDVPDFNGVYEPPDTGEIKEPSYLEAEISAIDEESEYPEAPEIEIDGLFVHDKPEYGQIDEFSKEAPSLNIDSIGSELGSLSSLSLSQIPEPNISHGKQIGAVPDVNIPTYSASKIDEVASPEKTEDAFKDAYHQALPAMQQFIDDKVGEWISAYSPNLKNDINCLSEKIEAVVKGRETALSNEFEKGLLARARSVTSIESQRAQAELEQGQARRGFKLPQGALLGGRHKLEQAVADSLSKQSVEFAIQRRAAEVQHLQFAMSLSLQNSQMLIGTAMSWAQVLANNNSQALSYAKDVALQITDHYNQLIKKSDLEARLQLNDIKVFEAELKGALALHEGYRLELESAMLADKRDDGKIRLYEARIKAQGLVISNSSRAIDAAYKKASIEKIKTELFAADVNAYLGKIKTVEAELGVYNAAMKGDESLLKAELSKVDVYEQQTEVAISKQQIKIQKLEAINRVNSNKTQQYQAQVSKYQAELKAELQKYSTDSEKYSKELQKIAIEIALTKDSYANKKESIVAVAEIAKQRADHSLKRIELNAELFTEKTRLIADTSVTVGKMFADMASAGINANHTMVSESTTT